jgi:hypothetical protein
MQEGIKVKAISYMKCALYRRVGGGEYFMVKDSRSRDRRVDLHH